MQDLNLNLDPAKFYALVEIIKSVDTLQRSEIKHLMVELENSNISNLSRLLEDTNRNFILEIERTTRRNDLTTLEQQFNDVDKFRHTAQGLNFINIAALIFSKLDQCHRILNSCLKNLIPNPVLTSGTKADFENISFEQIQKLQLETQLNSSNISKFVGGCIDISAAQSSLLSVTQNVAHLLEQYYNAIRKRHTDDGIDVYIDPVVTDIALSVFENIDAHGEIESGKKEGEISAYTLRKAELMVGCILNDDVFGLISKPEAFILVVQKHIKDLWVVIDSAFESYGDIINNVLDTIDYNKQRKIHHSIENELYLLDKLSPHAIVSKAPEKMLSAVDRFNLSFKNETVKKIANLLLYGRDIGPVVQYVLKRKVELRKFFQEENSFYVCQIGAGNPFAGEAPGALAVIPGIKPNANIEDLIGSNFDKIRDLVSSIEAAEQWQDLFIATSPSKSADKSNGLLCGPPGTGKSEALRAIASAKDSIGVYAQGSDFLTCWKGEAEKNPKRLFEGAIKLKKQSNKHVHILIDEIDSILKKKEHLSYGETDLTLEFQMLMDGIVDYPGLTVWGTTNFPDRIPLAMIRRFGSVLIVGELDNSQRVRLLKQFANYMPVDDSFSDKEWESQAKKLDGATGDVIRKVVDHVWRQKLTKFVQEDKKGAADIKDYLANLFDDKRFDIKKFDAKQRQSFKNKLRPHVLVKHSDIANSISMHLKNIAIYSEIQSAKETYKKAHEFLANLEATSV